MKKSTNLVWIQFVLIGLLIIAALGCSGSNVTGVANESDQAVSAPEEASLNGRIYSLEPYLWRDFMPMIGQDSMQTSLTALVRVVTEDSREIPPTVTAERLWIVNGDETWETDFDDEQRLVFKTAIERVARYGPFWETGIEVEVIVLLSDGSDEILLKATDIIINRTD